MLYCEFCEQNFSRKFSFERHLKTSKFCKAMRNCNEDKCRLVTELDHVKNMLNQRKEKCMRLKETLRNVIIDRNEILEENQKLQDEITRLKEKMKDDYYCHKLQIAETRVEEKEKSVQMMADVAKNTKGSTSNKTVINNTNNIVIQDFRVLPAKELESDTDEITQVIAENSVDDVCRYLLKTYYHSIPPNIKLVDQARKKIYVARDNKWVQENLESLVHKLFCICFQKVAYNCIDNRLLHYNQVLENPIASRKKKDDANDQIIVWESIRKTWEDFDINKLQKSLMITIDNLQRTEIEN